MKDIQYQIIKNIFNLSVPTESGWIKQLNLVSWGDTPPMYDIRKWKYENGNVVGMSKGTSLTPNEFKALVQFCKEFNIDN